MPLIPLALQLAQFVPAILRWISGDNPEPIAQKIIDVAQTVTGATTPAEAVQALITEPDKQRAFSLAIQDKADDMEKAYLADRADARARDVEMRKTTGGKNARADNLAYLAIFALIGCIAMVFATTALKLQIDAAAEKILYLLIGSLIVICKDVYGFEFGSSKGAERNAQAFADVMSNQNGK